MKVDLYNAIVSAQMSRRKMLKGSASLGAVAAMGEELLVLVHTVVFELKL